MELQQGFISNGVLTGAAKDFVGRVVLTPDGGVGFVVRDGDELAIANAAGSGVHGELFHVAGESELAAFSEMKLTIKNSLPRPLVGGALSPGHVVFTESGAALVCRRRGAELALVNLWTFRVKAVQSDCRYLASGESLLTFGPIDAPIIRLSLKPPQVSFGSVV